MQIERVDFTVPGDRMSGLYAVDRADPGPGPRMSFRHFQVVIERGRSNERSEAWVARRSGEIVGGYALHYPQSDNTHLALIRVLAVHPDHRRNGVGRSLLRHAIDRARAERKRVILGEAAADQPGAPFAEAFGFSPATTEARRVLDLRTADWSGFELMRGEAARHARDYSLERWAGPVSEEQLGDMAKLMSGMNDEPLGDLNLEDQRWDPAKVRAHDRMMAAAGLRAYTMVARHTGTGDPAGFTRIVVDAHEPEGWARQHDTAVLHPHRGRRLGLVLKLANLAWFHACEPSVERVVTWNSTSNSHMLAINEKMGFQVLDVWNEWQLHI